jgi:hypothetical protein
LATQRSLVLLKNGNDDPQRGALSAVLPFRTGMRTAVIGPHYNATWAMVQPDSGDVCPSGGVDCIPSPLERIAAFNGHASHASNGHSAQAHHSANATAGAAGAAGADRQVDGTSSLTIGRLGSFLLANSHPSSRYVHRVVLVLLPTRTTACVHTHTACASCFRAFTCVA